MIKVLFAAAQERWDEYQLALRGAFDAAGLDVDLAEHHPPEDVAYIIYTPASGLLDLTPYHACKGILSLWAGVETVVSNPTLTQPLARMVDPGLTEGMVEYVTGHVLRHHLGIDAQLAAQNGRWDPIIPPLARDRRIGILGLGALGAACAAALSQLNFPVSGWSKTQKTLAGIRCLSGPDGLTHILGQSDILVLLLPLTADTKGVLDASALATLPKGAVVINPGRGPLIDDDALLAALDANHVSHATLDVFATEPLPPGHPFWGHPRITVTPHVASATRPETAAHVIAENIRRGEAGQPLLNLVDRNAGY